MSHIDIILHSQGCRQRTYMNKLLGLVESWMYILRHSTTERLERYVRKLVISILNNNFWSDLPPPPESGAGLQLSKIAQLKMSIRPSFLACSHSPLPPAKETDHSWRIRVPRQGKSVVCWSRGLPSLVI